MPPQSKAGWIKRMLARRHAGLLFAALACLLCVPSLWTGLMVDDYWLLAAHEGIPGVQQPRGPLDLFAFYRPDDVPRLKEQGVLPWWSLPDSRFAFWRPLTSATHALDFRLWPGLPVLMHLQSLAWLGALVLLVSHLHRRLCGVGWVAGLATLLYAVDDAHAISAGWIASRNGLLAAFFGLGALALHVRWRDRGKLSAAFLAPLSLLVGLLSNEGAVAAGAYLLAYAVFLDRGRTVSRLSALIPYAVVVLVWRALYLAGGYGITGGDFYVDPVATPFRFALAVVYRGPALLLGQWALPPSDVFSMPSTPPIQSMLIWLFAVVVLACIALLIWPLLRRDRTSRFWCAAMLLSLIPGCAAGSGDRLLLFVGVAATALLASFLAAVHEGTYPIAHALGRRLHRPFFRMFVAVHLVVAPVLLGVNPLVLHRVWDRFDRAIRTAPVGEDTDRTMVVVNARHLLMFVRSVRGLNGQPVPGRMRSLGPTTGSAVPLHLSRRDEQTLVVRPRDGFTRCPQSRERRLALPDLVELTGMRVEILERDGRHLPLEVAYVFDVPLEDESLVWLQRTDDGFETFAPPDVGQAVMLDAE